MFYECEEHKTSLINEMKCLILIVFFKKGKKDISILAIREIKFP